MIDPDIKYKTPTRASPTPIGYFGVANVIPAVNKPKKNKMKYARNIAANNKRKLISLNFIPKSKIKFEVKRIIEKLNKLNGSPALALPVK